MRRRLALLVLPAGFALLVAGCASNNKPTAAVKAPNPAASSAAASVSASSGQVTVSTTEYAFAPMAIKAKAGKLKITLENKGKIPHELVLLKTASAANALRVAGAGRVSEKASVGEVSETAAGTTKSKTLDLKPGNYLYVCNIPGHYGDGMYGTLTVT